MPNPRGHKCEECGRVFKTALALKMHQRCHGSRQDHHRAFQKPVLQSSLEVGQDGGPSQVSAEAAKQVPTSQEHYICTECGENLESFNAMKAHQHTAGNGTVAEAAEGQAAPLYTELYPCSQCHKSYKSHASLGRHYRIHVEKCGQVCRAPHRKLLPTLQERTGCSGGREGLPQTPRVRRSLRQQQARAQPLHCTECHQEFKMVAELHEHYMRHATEEP